MKWFSGDWFYSLWDTILLTVTPGRAFLPEDYEMGSLDKRQLFLADKAEYDDWNLNYEVTVIKRFVLTCTFMNMEPWCDLGCTVVPERVQNHVIETRFLISECSGQMQIVHVFKDQKV